MNKGRAVILVVVGAVLVMLACCALIAATLREMPS